MAPSWDPAKDMPSLEGKVAIVTGGNSGIGYHTVRFLALAGAKVYMGARSEEKAIKAIKAIMLNNQDIEKGSVEWLYLDLTNVPSVLEAARKINGKETRLDILINNAGIVPSNIELTDAGWEASMMANYIGHFIFTNHLLALMKSTASAGADVRIVTLSSNVIYIFIPPSYPFNFDSHSVFSEPLPTTPWSWYIFKHAFRFVNMPLYAISKIANTIFAQELQRRLDAGGSDIISTSVHPGGVSTDAALGIFAPILKPLMQRGMYRAAQGAITPLFAATAKEVRQRRQEYAGRFLEPFGKIGKPHTILGNFEAINALWEGTENEVGEYVSRNRLAPLQPW